MRRVIREPNKTKKGKLAMKWSWRIGRIAGIDVEMHATFLILLVWVGVYHYLPKHSWTDVLDGIIFTIALFGIVVLHELGHALTARRFGIRTRDITLWPIGGVSRLERMPDDAKQELLVALAGPAVNVVLALGLSLLLAPGHGSPAIAEVKLVGGSFLVKLIWVNIMLVFFNLIPAFPMDGGRVLRALLAMRMDYVEATNLAAMIGQVIAFLLGLLGLFFNPFLFFIALFVWMGAGAEASMVQIKSALGGIPVSRAMITDFRTLGPDDLLRQAVDYIMAGFQQDFPVVKDGRVVGILTRTDLLKVLTQKGPDAHVIDAMQPRFETTDPSEMLESVLLRLQSSICRSLPVVRDGQLVGMLTMDNVGEFLMIQAALHGARFSGSARRDGRRWAQPPDFSLK
jgi:Zn-dependent protease/predicted transcriptional regulator